MKNFRPDFIQIPFIVIEHPEIKPLDYLVYGYVYMLENLSTGKCIASNAYIAKALNCSVGSVQNSLTRLEKVGFIKRNFLDAEKKKRVQIITNVRYRVSSDDDTMYHQKMIGVSSENDHIKKSYIKENNRDSEIEKIIYEFSKTIDLKNKKLYGNTTQRNACDFLIENYGLENVLTVISEILPKTNKRPRYEFPHISTPWELMQNWAKIKDGIITKQEKLEENNVMAFY